MKKEKAIWLFAGGPMQAGAAIKIQEAGYKLIITDMNPDCACAGYADELVEADTFDINKNLKSSRTLSKKYSIKAVVTAAADCHETVSRVGKSLGLHAIDPLISRSCRYKNFTRDLLKKAQILQPRFKSVKGLKEAREFIGALGGRGALKATNSSGSRGFSAIEHIEELTPEAFDSALSAGTTGNVLVEELLSPLESEIAELSVETVWSNGRMYWLNWVDRLFRKDFLLFKGLKGAYGDVPWGVELGHINPAVHRSETKEKIRDMIYRAGIAIGMGRERGGHILKADVMLTADGAYLLELTPRLSGGWDSSGSTPARGADFTGGAIAMALNRRLDINMWHEYFEYKNPSLYASVMARVEPDAKDCIGRRFAVGTGFEREASIGAALKNLKRENYVISVEQ
ncbi:MAG: hypothetical protein AABZ23_04830 [Deltaproteobacteria bacterium]